MLLNSKQFLYLAFFVVALAFTAITLFEAPKEPFVSSYEVSEVLSKPGFQTSYSQAKDGSFTYLDLTEEQPKVVLVKGKSTVDILFKADMVSQSLSPSGSFIAVVTHTRQGKCRIYLYDIKTGNEHAVAACKAPLSGKLAWSQDEILFFVRDYDDTKAIQHFDPMKFDVVEYTRKPTLKHVHPLKQPNLLAFSEEDTTGGYTLSVLDNTGKITTLKQSKTPIGFCFSQGHELMIVVTDSGKKTVLQALDLNGTVIKQLQLPFMPMDLYCHDSKLYYSQMLGYGKSDIFSLSFH